MVLGSSAIRLVQGLKDLLGKPQGASGCPRHIFSGSAKSACMWVTWVVCRVKMLARPTLGLLIHGVLGMV